MSWMMPGSSELNKLIPSLHILVLPSVFHNFKYPQSTAVPSEIYSSDKYSFVSVTKTSDELSIVLGYKDDPSQSRGDQEASKSTGTFDPDRKVVVNRVEELGDMLAGRWTGPWRCLKVRGPMYLSRC